MDIWTSSELGNVDNIRELLRAGCEPDARDKEKITPLMLAALHKQKAACQTLIAAGADLAAADRCLWTPLMYAASGGSAEVVEVLLKAGALVDTRDENGRTALIEATHSDHSSALKMLGKYGADIDATDNDGTNALTVAIKQGHLNAFRTLLEMGARVAVTDPYCATPLAFAAAHNQTALIKKLIAMGEDPNFASEGSFTPLASAVLRNHVEAVDLLLKSGALSGAHMDKGRSAFDVAGNAKEKAFHTLLLNSMPSPSEQNTLFKSAVECNNLHLLKELLRRKYSPPNDLLVLAAWRDSELLKFILDEVHEVQIDAESPYGQTALMVAAQLSSTALVRLLLQRGASANHRNDAGIGAAYIAAERGNAEVLQFLLEHGSDACLCTVNDVTLLMVAARSGDADTCQLLLRHGADIQARDKGGCTALSYAIESGKRSGSVVRCLLAGGADPNGKEGSFKPLLLACYYGCYNERYSRPNSLDEDPMTETIQMLLAAGADPADLNLFWSTEKRPAIDFAREVRAPQIIRQLEEAMAS